MATELPAAAPAAAPEREGLRKSLFSFLRRNASKKTATALALWRIEARFATPVALLLIATIGRWPAALSMGAIMAVYSAAFLYLLDGENIMHEIREWMRQREWARKYALPIAERRDRIGTVQRAVAVPATIMLLGPFWRAVTYHLFRMPRALAYIFSVGGSFPHSLFWTGLVLGGLWEVAIQPAMAWAWEQLQALF